MAFLRVTVEASGGDAVITMTRGSCVYVKIETHAGRAAAVLLALDAFLGEPL